MKITDEEIKKIINEVLNEQDDFGKTKASIGQRSADLKQRSKEIHTQRGVDDKERGIISQIEKLLTQLADQTDIKGGVVNSKLKKLYSVLKSELGDQQDDRRDSK
jgi:DNA-binding TFAR19-related protein (PDSD5 family)